MRSVLADLAQEAGTPPAALSSPGVTCEAEK